MTNREILNISQYRKKHKCDTDKKNVKHDSCKLSINAYFWELWDKKNVNHFNNSVLVKMI